MRARRQTGEGGFTLIEVIVAMTLLAIGLMGLAQLAGSELTTTLKNHIRQSAIAYVNQELETVRSMSYTSISVDPTAQSQAPWTAPNGRTYSNPVVGSTGCGGTTCLAFSTPNLTLSVGQNPPQTFKFNEYRWVTGTGTAPNYSYKTVSIFLTSASGPSFTYSAQTDVNGSTTNTPTPVNDLEVSFEAVDSSGNQLFDGNGVEVAPPNGFQITVTGTGVNLTDTSADASWDTTALPAGSYSCTVSNTGPGTQNWVLYPGNSGSTTFPCDDPGTYPLQWHKLTCQNPIVDTAGAFNSLVIKLQNADGTGINNINVPLTASTPHQKPLPKAAATNSQGVVTYNNVPPGSYTINIAGGGGYFGDNGSTICMWNGVTGSPTESDLYITLASNAAKAQMATISVPVQNTNPIAGTAEMEVEAVADDGSGDTYFEQQNLNSGASASTVAVPVAAGSTYNGSYTVSVYCVGSDGLSSDGTKTTWSWTSDSPLGNNAVWTPTINGQTASLTNPAGYAC